MPAETTGGEKDRIAKVMARAGLCSRRDAEAWIKAGRVAVNGKLLTSPAMNVGPDDVITVDGQAIEARERTRLFFYHKPRGLVTTAKDPEGRPTVFDNLPEGLPRVVSIGRLDINTEGLLLLTNDGGLARVLELPQTGWLRRYRVRANGFISQDKLDALKDGITIDGIDYAGIEAQLDRAQGANVWLTMGLREGKNREIKRVLEHLGLVVNRLIRLSFGPFQLGELPEGEVEEVRTRVLQDQLGPTLAAEAGVEWEDPVTAEVVTRDLQSRERTERKGSEDRSARNGGGRGKARPEAPPPPRQDRPAPGARPHVSVLRGERTAKDEGPRKRISRASTEDRRGRTVKIERITVEKKERHTGEGGTSRNARNFARERRAAIEATSGEAPRPARRSRPAGDDPAPRSRRFPAESDGRRDGPAAGGEARRPKRSSFGSDRPQTGRALKDAKPRSTRRPGGDAKGERPSRPPGGSGPRPKPPRGPGGGGAPRGRGGDRPRSRS